MLTDAQVERYSRQILLPEVGGRGQARLLAARVAVVGAGVEAAAAACLLGRAGVGTLDLATDGPALAGPSPECALHRWADLATAPAPDVTVDLAGGTGGGRPAVLGALAAGTVSVLALAGRPCGLCVDPGRRPAAGRAASGVLAAAASAALGALAAGEALRLLLLPAAPGRATVLALDAGTVTASPVEPTAGCPVCGRAA